MLYSAIVLLAVVVGLWLRCWRLHHLLGLARAKAGPDTVYEMQLEDEVESLEKRLSQANRQLAARVLERDSYIQEAEWLERAVARMARAQGVPESAIARIIEAARQAPTSKSTDSPDDEVTVPLPKALRTNDDAVARAEVAIDAALVPRGPDRRVDFGTGAPLLPSPEAAL